MINSQRKRHKKNPSNEGFWVTQCQLALGMRTVHVGTYRGLPLVKAHFWYIAFDDEFTRCFADYFINTNTRSAL